MADDHDDKKSPESGISRPKIAFIRPGRKMPANISFHHALVNAFPEHEIMVVDIQEALSARHSARLRSIFHAFREYGWEILARRKSLKACELKTTWFQNTVKEIVAESIESDECDFSIQIQSLFDASVPGLKHYVYTDHTHLANLQYASFDKRRLFSGRWLELEKSIYANADAVFTRSTNIQRSIESDYGCPPERVECVYAGSNAALPDAPISRERYRSRNILFVGIDWVRKGGPVLLDSFQRVLRTHPDAQLTIVGTSPDVAVPNCHVVGRVPLEQVNRYFEAASIFCMPTEIEPFGIVFVEALSHGLPIVSTNVGALPDIVVDGVNGYLVDPQDATALARSLDMLLSDERKCEEFGARSRDLAESRYNWDSVGQRIRERILTAADERSGGNDARDARRQ